MIAEYREVLQLAFTAGAGDLTMAGLLMARRQVSGTRQSVAQPEAASALSSLVGLSWESFSQLLRWGWEHLGIDVEVTNIAGPVDFILTDEAGYTYVQARGWRKREVSAADVESLRTAMEVVGVGRGIVMSCGRLAPGVAHMARTAHIRVIETEELAVMIELLRSGAVEATPGEGSGYRPN